MICERCRIAGDLNNQLNDLLVRWSGQEQPPNVQSRAANLRESIEYNHNHCRQHGKLGCLCQHRIGEYVARRNEEEEVSSPVGDGDTNSEDEREASSSA